MDLPSEAVLDPPAEVFPPADDADATNILFSFRQNLQDVAAPVNLIADSIKRQAAEDVSDALIETVNAHAARRKAQGGARRRNPCCLSPRLWTSLRAGGNNWNRRPGARSRGRPPAAQSHPLTAGS